MGKKKSNGKKKAAPRSRRRANAPPAKADLALACDVWAAYERTRSTRLVAQDVGVPVDRVRAILNADRPRVRRILNEMHEIVASKWETTEIEMLALIDEAIWAHQGFFAELRAAAAEGRMTTIANRDGFPMPVLDAMQMLMASGMLERLARVAQLAKSMSMDHRSEAPKGLDAILEAMSGSSDDVDFLPDEGLAKLLAESGVDLPPVLRKKVERMLPAGD